MELDSKNIRLDLKKLMDNPSLDFNNGKINNKEALRGLIKLMRKRGYKILKQEVIITMIKREGEQGNIFGIMYLTQFCNYWAKEFKPGYEIDMGQVDILLRKYYK